MNLTLFDKRTLLPETKNPGGDHRAVDRHCPADHSQRPLRRLPTGSPCAPERDRGRHHGPAAGECPEQLTGAVFPCSAVTIRDDQVKKIQDLPGVRGIGKAVLLWVFDPNRAWIVLGIEQQNTVGPATLSRAVTEGRFLEEGKSEALVEVAYARQFDMKVGDTISVAKRSFPVVGADRCLPGGEDRRGQCLSAPWQRHRSWQRPPPRSSLSRPSARPM